MNITQKPSNSQQNDNHSHISLLLNTVTKEDSKVQHQNASYVSVMDDQETEEVHGENIQEIPEFIVALILKGSEERTSSDNSALMKYVLNKSIFKELSLKLPSELIKSMLRQSNIKIHKEGDLVCSQGRRLREVSILLSGQVAIIHDQNMYITIPEATRKTSFKENTNNGNSKTQKKGSLDFIDILIEKIGREPKNYKIKANVQQKRGDMMKSIVLKKETIDSNVNLRDFEKISKQEILDSESLFDPASRHFQTIAVSKPSVILRVPIEVFYEIIYNTYQTKMYQVIKLFRKISVFDPFQNSKLKTLIERLKIVEYKKGEYIYKEGDQTDCFYMLINGQVQISKSIEIFSENPNNLYKNRVKMSRQRVSEKIKILPYANFNRAYNFVAEQKTITLAQINPICLFGQQQILSKGPREVNAKVLSFTAEMYKIRLQDMQQVCSKMISSSGQKKLTLLNFLNLIQERITMKKILLRQNQLSQMVEYQNKNNFQKLFSQKQANMHLNFRKTHSKHKQIMINNNFLDKTILQEEEAPPLFNHFNYNEFMNEQNEQMSLQISSNLNEEETRVAKLTHLRCKDPENSQKKSNTIRKRNTSHTDYRSKEKLTIQSSQTLQTISFVNLSSDQRRDRSMQQKITIEKPLFNLNFFSQQERWEKRLLTQAKKKRLQQLYRDSVIVRKKSNKW